MLYKSEVTMFAVPKERTTRSGETYERLEAYGDLDKVASFLTNAKANGDTVIQILPRVYEKDGENRIAIEMHTFKGKDKK